MLEKIDEEKMEMFDYCNLDLKDEIFKLRLVISYIKQFSESVPTEEIENYMLCIIDKLKDILVGYNLFYDIVSLKEVK